MSNLIRYYASEDVTGPTWSVYSEEYLPENVAEGDPIDGSQKRVAVCANEDEARAKVDELSDAQKVAGAEPEIVTLADVQEGDTLRVRGDGYTLDAPVVSRKVTKVVRRDGMTHVSLEGTSAQISDLDTRVVFRVSRADDGDGQAWENELDAGSARLGQDRLKATDEDCAGTANVEFPEPGCPDHAILGVYRADFEGPIVEVTAYSSTIDGAVVLEVDTFDSGDRIRVNVNDGTVFDADPEKGTAIEQLKAAHGGTWGQHPSYPQADWRGEVVNADTVLGYWEWVLAKLEAEEDDEESVRGCSCGMADYGAEGHDGDPNGHGEDDCGHNNETMLDDGHVKCLDCETVFPFEDEK